MTTLATDEHIFTDERIPELLTGAVDLHVHPAPSPFPRNIGIRGVAEQAHAAGFRAILIKSHHHSMVTDIAAVDDAMGGLPLPVYSGVALNNYVGGINPYAVELSLQMGGRMVWMPTVSSEQHICVHEREEHLKFPSTSIKLRKTTPIPVLDADGELLPDTTEVLQLVKDADAILSTGHMSPPEITAVLRAANRMGLRRMVVNHPNFVSEANPDQAREWVELGAVVEHGLVQYDDRTTFYQWNVDTMLRFIQAVGIDNTIIGSDLGQKNNPFPVDAYERVLGQLLDAGVSPGDVHKLVAVNTGRVLDG
ncbi:DUF6282 family protein [Arthrobacter sp. ISL-72]|uniref:DUF6282 family protein n=1 Tax=Arthrobacter sp. ISL-72 TaxID=2819114 RepID=UPI001BED3399|nr:DUF6282 family protein [Arthrobacter sp. ISL-72]MBT2597959.1 hypothetical protein [Arthrobacter sp. ISL-72]